MALSCCRGRGEEVPEPMLNMPPAALGTLNAVGGAGPLNNAPPPNPRTGGPPNCPKVGGGGCTGLVGNPAFALSAPKANTPVPGACAPPPPPPPPPNVNTPAPEPALAVEEGTLLNPNAGVEVVVATPPKALKLALLPNAG